ncbi:MAG TPA: YncE family protein [Myxococcales bacterium]|nr:YncE family protein [Myxococcales bacterium]
MLRVNAGNARRRSELAALVLPLAACAMFQRVPERPPLDREGEVALLLTTADETKRVDFEVESAEAVRDGLRVPLEGGSAATGSPAAKQQRRIAFGRLEPGAYRGFSVQLRHPVSGDVQLAEPKGPTHIDAPFSVSPRQATVVTVRAAFGRLAAGAPLEVTYTASVPPRTVPALAGLCTQSETHDVALFDKRSREVTALLPTGRAPWGLAIDPVLNRAWVSLEGDDEIAVVDLANAAELSRIRLNAGDGPRELLLTADRRTLISANFGSNTVSLIDAGAMIETGRIQVAEGPTALLSDRKGQRVYVFHQRSNAVSVIDTGTRTLVSTLPTDNPPLRGQIDAAGARLYLASPVSTYLTVLALPGFAPLQRVYVGTGTTALKIDTATGFLYVAGPGGRVQVFDPVSLIPVDVVELPSEVAWMSIDQSENTLFALMPSRRSVAVINLATKSVIAEFDVGPEARVLGMIGERN